VETFLTFPYNASSKGIDETALGSHTLREEINGADKKAWQFGFANYFGWIWRVGGGRPRLGIFLGRTGRR